MTYQRPTWLPDWISITDDGRISWYPGGARGQGKRTQARKGGVAAAELFARELITQAARTANLRVELGTTWTDLAHAWVAAHEGTVAEGTLRRRTSALNAWVIPLVGDTPVTDTTLATLLTVADEAAKTLGRSGFDSVVQTVTVVATWGMDRRWLPAGALGTDDERRRALKRLRTNVRTDPARRAQSDGDEDRHIRPDQVPSWDDVCALADTVADRIGGRARSRNTGDRYGRAVRIAAGTGLRLCELLGLTVEQVDLDTGLITVTHQLDRYVPWDGTGPMPTTPPKHGGTRVVGMWAKVRDDVHAAVNDTDNLLFPPFDRQTWWADAWSRLLLAARADIGWQWEPHWLRHHYGSVSITPREHGGLGLPPAVVQRYLGHRNLSTTLDTYIQPTAPPVGWVS